MQGIYSRPWIFRLVMRCLYGRYYSDRLESIVSLIEDGSSVLDVCCGPGLLYHQLKRARRGCRYVGLDINRRFIAAARRQGIDARKCNIFKDGLPAGEFDYVVMVDSLYQFIPEHGAVLKQLSEASLRFMIISEPMRNLGNSRNAAFAWLARKLTDPGTGETPHRFTEETIDASIRELGMPTIRSFRIPGGRDKVFFLNRGSPSIRNGVAATNP